MSISLNVPDFESGNSVKSKYDIYIPDGVAEQIEERLRDPYTQVDGMIDIMESGEIREVQHTINDNCNSLFRSGLKPVMPDAIGFKRYMFSRLPNSQDVEVNTDEGVSITDYPKYIWEKYNRAHISKYMSYEKAKSYTYMGDSSDIRSSIFNYMKNIVGIPSFVAKYAKRDKALANRTITFPVLIVKKLNNETSTAGDLSVYVTPYLIAEVDSEGYSASKKIRGVPHRLWEYSVKGLSGGSSHIINEGALEDFSPLEYEFRPGTQAVMGTYSNSPESSRSVTGNKVSRFTFSASTNVASEYLCQISHTGASSIYVWVPESYPAERLKWISTGTSLISVTPGEILALFDNEYHMERLGAYEDYGGDKTEEEVKKLQAERLKRVKNLLESSERHYREVVGQIHGMDFNIRNKTIANSRMYYGIASNAIQFSTIGSVHYKNIQDGSMMVLYISVQYNPFNMLNIEDGRSLSLDFLHDGQRKTDFTSGQILDYFGVSLRLDAERWK